MSKNIDEKLLSFEDIESQNNDLENLNKLTKYNYYPKDWDELYDLIKKLIYERGNKADLNDIYTGDITSMRALFVGSNFNGDISKWDVSKVENMADMFYNSKFNGDISTWDVHNVKNMNSMFFMSKFNGDISKWDVSNVEDMTYMFASSNFNGNKGDISNWDVSNVKYMRRMFNDNHYFDKDLSKWNMKRSPECDTTDMFRYSLYKKKYNINSLSEKLLSFEDKDSEDTDLENLNEISKIAERKKWLEEFKNPKYEGINIHSFLDYYLTSRYTKECAKYKSYQDIKGDTVLINTTNYKPLVDETGEYIFESASFWYYDGFGFYIDHRNTSRWNRINFVNFDGKLFFKKDIYTVKKVIYCKDDGNIFLCFKPLKTSRDYIVNQNGDVYRFLKQYNIYSSNSEYDTSKEFLSMLEAFETSLNVNDDDFLNKIKLLEAKEVNEKLLSFEDTKTEDNDLENLNELTKFNYYPKTRDELEALVNELIEERGKNANLNDIYTGDITDMSWIFYDSKFNGDISKWDVSNVKDMSYMFYYSFFNGDISNWNVSNVENMADMFYQSKFNGDISKWDVSNVRNMSCMFCSSAFNRDISKWDVSNVRNMTGLFYASPFTCNISNWNINPECVTRYANFPFNLKKVNEKLLSFKDTKTEDNDLENLNELTKFNYYPKTRDELVDIVDKLIEERGFNADLNDIYTSNITSMAYLFFKINFNGDISKWDVSNVKSMVHMFANSPFNGDISKWNVSNVKYMSAMFYNSKFNGDISKWNVSNVEDMSYIFDGSSFNGDVSDWNINPECNIRHANFPNKEIYEKLLSFKDAETKDNDLENFKKFEDVAARKKEFEENWEYLGDERYECNDLYRRVAKYKKLNGGSKIIDTCNFLINNGSYELLFPLTDEYQFHNVTRFTYLGPKYNLYAARASRIIKDKNDLLKIRPKGGVAFFEYNIIFNDGTFLFPEWVSKYYIVPDIAKDPITEEPFFNIRSSEAGVTFRFYFNGDIIDISQQPWTKLPKDITIEEYCKLKIKNES